MNTIPMYETQKFEFFRSDKNIGTYVFLRRTSLSGHISPGSPCLILAMHSVQSSELPSFPCPINSQHGGWDEIMVGNGLFVIEEICGVQRQSGFAGQRGKQ